MTINQAQKERCDKFKDNLYNILFNSFNEDIYLRDYLKTFIINTYDPISKCYKLDFSNPQTVTTIDPSIVHTKMPAVAPIYFYVNNKRIFQFYQTNLQRRASTDTPSLPSSMNDLFDRVIDRCKFDDWVFITYYFYKCTNNGKFLELLSQTDESNNYKILDANNEDIQNVLFDISYSLEKGYHLIDPDAKIETLIENGWGINCETNARNIYNKNTSAHSQELQKKISALKKEEFDFFFKQYTNFETFSQKDYEDVLKAILKIEIFKINDTLGFEIRIAPIYEACKSNFEKKVDRLFSENYLPISKYDLKIKFGQIALGTQAKNPPHLFEINASDNIFSFSEQLVKYKLLIKGKTENDRLTYRFAGKFERIWLEAFAYAQENDESFFEHSADIANHIVENFIKYESPQSGDHRRYNLAPTCLFALTVLNNINKKLKLEVIESLCAIANDFDSKKRQAQESAILILSYFLFVGTEFSYDIKEKIFNACFRGLYPSQISIYKALCEKDKFFRAYPQDKFKNSLVFNDTSEPRKIKGQPYFYLLQGLCRDTDFKYNRTSFDEAAPDWSPDNLFEGAYVFLNNSIHLEDDIWVNSNLKSKYLNLCIPNCIKFDMNNFMFYTAPINIIAFNLTFYALSDLVNKKASLKDTIENCNCLSYNNKQDGTWQNSLLKNVFFTDYFQRKYNPCYGSKEISDLQEDLILICGSFRMINAFDFENASIEMDINVTHNQEIINDYKSFLQYEKTDTRYFWFMCRLLSFIKNPKREKIFSLDEILNLTHLTETELAEKFEKTFFLEYDNFPKSFYEFKESTWPELS